MSDATGLIDRLRRRVAALFPDTFFRDVSVLAAGTGIAQAAALLALPVLTRLYSPADFSALAVYASIVSLLAVAACLRFDAAIPIPADDRQSANLLVLALLIAFAVAAAVAVVALLWGPSLLQAVGQPALAQYALLIPVGIWLASSFSALQYWATRRQYFPAIARNRMLQALGTVGTQLALGAARAGPAGLVVGHAAGFALGTVGLAGTAVRRDRGLLASVSPSGMLAAGRAHDRFPKYSTLEVLANNTGIHLPLVLIAALAEGPEAGLLFLGLRAMQVPMSLVGTSVAQVFYAHAPAALRRGDLGRLTADTIGSLARLAVGPIVFVGLIAPQVFGPVFGEEWSRAGDLVRWMAAWIALQFVSSPVSMLMHVVGRQREMMWLTIAGMVLRVLPVLVVASYSLPWLSEAYIAGSALFYLALGITITMRAGCSAPELARALRPSAGPVAAWTAAGFVALWFVRQVLA